MLTKSKSSRTDTGFWEEYRTIILHQEAAYGADRNSEAWVQ
jgi:hypothetical protein